MTEIKEVKSEAKENAVAEFRALYRMVNHEHRHDRITELYRLEAELVIAGYA